jgi:hypothetical protein
MSIFRTVEVPCPACGSAVRFELVHSVNAGRRPDLREAILNRAFQRQPCPTCRVEFRTEPEFTYTDLGRKQFFAVWPSSYLGQWAEYEERTRKTFAAAFGAEASPAARDIGQGLTTRAIFGWPGVAEKLICADAGIDDVTLELAKTALLRSMSEVSVGASAELRYIGPQEDKLLFGWIQTATEEMTDGLSVAKTLIEEIEGAPEQWQPLRDELSAGLFVDYRRLLIGG